MSGHGTQQISRQEAIEAFIERTVAAAPELSERQRERLATLLRGDANVGV